MEYENEKVIAFCFKKNATFCFKKDATFEQLGNYSTRPNIASESTICTIIFQSTENTKNTVYMCGYPRP